MALFAGHLDLETVAARQGGPGTVGDLARLSGHDMQAENRIRLGFGEYPLLHHQLGARDFA
jgi:hypothetical protein